MLTAGIARATLASSSTAELFVIGRKKDLLIVGGENIYPQDMEEIVCNTRRIHDGRAIATGLYNPELGTEDIVVVAEVGARGIAGAHRRLEQEIRQLSLVTASGVACSPFI